MSARRKKFILLGMDHPHYNAMISAIKNRDDIDFTAIAQETAPFADEIAKNLNIRCYRNYIEALEQEKPDIVGIAMYNGARGQVINETLKRSIPVITDKPLCLTLEDLKQIKTTLLKTKVPLCMMLTCRTNPLYVTLKDAVVSGLIGDVLSVDAFRYYALNRQNRPDWMFKKESYGGPGIDILMHDYDLARWITGIDWGDVNLTEYRLGCVTDKDFSDSAIIFSENEGKILSLKMLWASSSRHWDRFIVLGTEGFLEINFCDKRLAYVNEKGDINYLSPLPDIKPFATQFFDAILYGKAKVPVSTEDSLLITERLIKANKKFLGTD